MIPISSGSESRTVALDADTNLPAKPTYKPSIEEKKASADTQAKLESMAAEWNLDPELLEEVIENAQDVVEAQEKGDTAEVAKEVMELVESIAKIFVGDQQGKPVNDNEEPPSTECSNCEGCDVTEDKKVTANVTPKPDIPSDPIAKFDAAVAAEDGKFSDPPIPEDPPEGTPLAPIKPSASGGKA